jgi:hypothetical protein
MFSDEVGNENRSTATDSHPTVNQHISAPVHPIDKVECLLEDSSDVVMLGVDGWDVKVLRNCRLGVVYATFLGDGDNGRNVEGSIARQLPLRSARSLADS